MPLRLRAASRKLAVTSLASPLHAAMVANGWPDRALHCDHRAPFRNHRELASLFTQHVTGRTHRTRAANKTTALTARRARPVLGIGMD
ncbi:hypothetical protein XocBAI20_18870, partial [Xanthomonas oryzae pv. oryzicola]